jgi:hypothetical protein
MRREVRSRRRVSVAVTGDVQVGLVLYTKPVWQNQGVCLRIFQLFLFLRAAVRNIVHVIGLSYYVIIIYCDQLWTSYYLDYSGEHVPNQYTKCHLYFIFYTYRLKIFTCTRMMNAVRSRSHDSESIVLAALLMPN